MRVAIFALFISLLAPSPAHAALNIPITVNLSESVNVTGTPQIAVDVGGTTRYATYTSGTGTNALTFTLAPQAGDVDLDGVTVSSPIQLNGGTIKDTKGNNATLTFIPPNTANVKVNYPSLGMDFVYDADGRYTLNGTPYNDLSSFLIAAGGSFTRASIGTYFDSTGTLQTAASGAPRFDYDPVTHTPKGILIEEARINQLLYSKDFSNVLWNNGGVTIVQNATTAPDGTSTAQKLVEDTSNARHNVQQSYTSTTGNLLTFSVYAKSAESTSFRMIIEGGNFVANFNLASQTTTAVTGSTTRTITSIGNGWYRCTMAATATYTGATSVRLHITTTNGPYTSFVGDGTTGIYFWGAQLEQGAFPTSYIPTTTAAVTRAADILTVPTGGWFNASAGTFAGQFNIYGFGPNRQYLFSPPNGDVGFDRLNIRGSDVSGAVPPSGVVGDGSGSVSTFAVSGAFIDPEKIAMAYSPTKSALSRKGSSVMTGVRYSGTSRASFGIGSDGSAARQLNGQIAKFKYYPAEISNTQLQLMTQ